MKRFKPTSTYRTGYPRGLGIALVLAALFWVFALDLAHLIALGYGGVVAVGHLSRASWRI